jgi:hypothetical protein
VLALVLMGVGFLVAAAINAVNLAVGS